MNYLGTPPALPAPPQETPLTPFELDYLDLGEAVYALSRPGGVAPEDEPVVARGLQTLRSYRSGWSMAWGLGLGLLVGWGATRLLR